MLLPSNSLEESMDNTSKMKLTRSEDVPVWKPKEESGLRIKKFMKIIEYKYKVKFDDYWDCHKWSVENIAELWGEIWSFLGIISSKTYDKVIDPQIPMDEFPKWFEGARLNFAENLLKYRDDHGAIIVAGEDRGVEKTTYKELYEEAKLYSAAFRKIGVKKGDIVTCYMSNRKEAVIAMLAATSIGAIWTGALPLLGPQAYLNRVGQVKPKVLITVDQFPHNKETKHLLENIKEISEGMPSLEKVIIVPSKPESKLKDISGIKNSCFLDDFLKQVSDATGSIRDMEFEQVSFSHPVFISYTSGTTGLPKTIVHGFGALFPGIRDFWIHWNSRREDVWLSMSPVGWVSWNMVTNVLFVGETIFLFEGVPFFLSPTFLWDMVDELKLSRLFMTPTTMDEMESRNYLPTERHHLTSLNMCLTGGSIAKPQNFEFALKKLKKDLMFCVGYGCTELMGFCMVSEQTLPVYIGEISAPALGVAAECLDETGNPIFGEMGEFAISAPMPSLPLGLWGDTDGHIFKKSYLSQYPGKFTCGDTVIINPRTKGFLICGRSDDTLKPRGCRFGSSEIYNIVDLFPEIKESLCVSQYNKEREERAVLFLKMRDGCSFGDELIGRLRHKIANELSVRHVPEVILEAPDIPHNINGKKTEIIIKKIINGMPYNAEMVANQECLNHYRNVPELQDF